MSSGEWTWRAESARTSVFDAWARLRITGTEEQRPWIRRALVCWARVGRDPHSRCRATLLPEWPRRASGRLTAVRQTRSPFEDQQSLPANLPPTLSSPAASHSCA